MDILDGAISKRMEINEPAVKKIIFTTCNQKGLDEYVRGIFFTNQKRICDSAMKYIVTERIMVMNCKQMGEFLSDVKSLSSDVIQKTHQDMYLKSLMEHIILHEIEHAHQNQMNEEKQTDIEARLVRLNISSILTISNPFLVGISNFYQPLKRELIRNKMMMNYLKEEYGIYSPTERLAEYHAVKEVLSYLSNNDTDYSDIETILNGVLINCLLEGYDFTLDIPSPTERYINDFKRAKMIRGNRFFSKEFYRLLDETKKDTLERRLSLGLEISKEEYTKVKRMLS